MFTEDAEQEVKSVGKSESILNNGKKSAEKAGESILNSEKSDIARLYTNIGRNGGVIFMLTSYLVKDEDDVLSKMNRSDLISIESLRGFNYDEIRVDLIDTRSRKGYAHINDEDIYIPLADLEGKNNKYFFDRNEVIKEIKKLMEVEYNAVKKIQEVSARTESFMKRALEKNLR